MRIFLDTFSFSNDFSFTDKLVKIFICKKLLFDNSLTRFIKYLYTKGSPPNIRYLILLFVYCLKIKLNASIISFTERFNAG